MADYAVLDIEATRGKKGEEAIIDISIYRFNGVEVVDQFGSMVNPEKNIEPYVQKLTGITNKMVKGAPKFYELAKRIVEITEGAIIVGHGVAFDLRMLRQEFHRLGYVFERQTIDTLPLSKKLLPDQASYSLGKLCRSLGIPVTDRHRAEGDTRATLDLFQLLLTKDTSKSIVCSFTQQEKTSKQTDKKLRALQHGLPRKTGVYYVHNAKGEIIYLQKADNIARSVDRLFASTQATKKQVQAKANHITVELTGSSLIAEIKAEEEIVKLAPLYVTKKPSEAYLYAFFFVCQPEGAQLSIEKIQAQTQPPLLVVKTHKQAESIYKKIQEQIALPAFSIAQPLALSLEQAEKIKAFFRLSLPSYLYVLKGRKVAEKGFVCIENQKVLAYGFSQNYKQLEAEEIRKQVTSSGVHFPWALALVHAEMVKRRKQKEQNIKTI